MAQHLYGGDVAAVMRGDDLGGERPQVPPFKIAAFFGAGAFLRHLQRRAQRQDHVGGIDDDANEEEEAARRERLDTMAALAAAAEAERADATAVARNNLADAVDSPDDNNANAAAVDDAEDDADDGGFIGAHGHSAHRAGQDGGAVQVSRGAAVQRGEGGTATTGEESASAAGAAAVSADVGAGSIDSHPLDGVKGDEVHAPAAAAAAAAIARLEGAHSGTAARRGVPSPAVEAAAVAGGSGGPKDAAAAAADDAGDEGSVALVIGAYATGRADADGTTQTSTASVGESAVGESSSAAAAAVAGASSEGESSGERVCRFCFAGEDDEDPGSSLSSTRGGAVAADDALISPCRCSGTQKWVHVGCLRQWQRVSMSSFGAAEAKCRVCHHCFRLPRQPLWDAARQWFAFTAKDRLLHYRSAWWQLLSNSIMAQEGTPQIATANQLARLLVATELRIWGSREVRGGNGFLREVQRGARWCTNVHSVVLLVWLVSIGAVNVGESLAQPGGPFDRLVSGSDRTAVIGGSNPWRRRGRPAWREGKVARWAVVFVGRPLGWLLRAAVPSAGAVMRVAQPVQEVICWFERYPQYRVV